MLVEVAVVVGAVIGLLSIYLVIKLLYSQEWPPGPKGQWFVGNALQINPRGIQFSLVDWAKQYGDIFKINLFGKNVIVLNGFEPISDVLVKYSTEFAGRPMMFAAKHMYHYVECVVFDTFSPRWLQRKKAVLKAMKLYGEETLESMALQAGEEALIKIADTNKEPFDPTPIIMELLNNVTASVMYGHTLSPEDMDEFTTLEPMLEECLDPGKGLLYDIFPFVRHIYKSEHLKELEVLADRMHRLHAKQTQARKDMYKEDEPRCLLDHLWQLQPTELDERGRQIFPDDVIQAMCTESTYAGTSTSFSTLMAMIAILTNHPDVQQKIQNLLDDKLGARQPRLSDRSSLPYIDAVIFETLRYITHIVINVPHETTQEVFFRGYHLSKGTEVWCNIWGLHHDERYWTDPWSFKPERFLDEDDNLVPPDHVNRQRLFSFGAGRRVCAGEVFAKNRLFLIISQLFQRFNIIPAEGQPKPSDDCREWPPSITMRPMPYKVCAIPRL